MRKKFGMYFQPETKKIMASVRTVILLTHLRRLPSKAKYWEFCDKCSKMYTRLSKSKQILKNNQINKNS